MNNNELKIMVPNGWVINEEVMADGTRMLVIKPNATTAEDTTCHLREGIFKKVPASELSLEDDFLKYIPKTEEEKRVKREIEKVIKAGVHDFWRPVCDPSFDADGRICYEPGKMPAMGKSYNWWEKNAKDFCPERGSRMGTQSEYVAFIAVLIKELVASGKSEKWAWHSVCINSTELGHHYIFEKDLHSFEPTGRREICGWFDLANTYKIMSDDKDSGGFWTGGSICYGICGKEVLADWYEEDGPEVPLSASCGWLVFDSCPDC